MNKQGLAALGYQLWSYLSSKANIITFVKWSVAIAVSTIIATTAARVVTNTLTKKNADKIDSIGKQTETTINQLTVRVLDLQQYMKVMIRLNQSTLVTQSQSQVVNNVFPTNTIIRDYSTNIILQQAANVRSIFADSKKERFSALDTNRLLTYQQTDGRCLVLFLLNYVPIAETIVLTATDKGFQQTIDTTHNNRNLVWMYWEKGSDIGDASYSIRYVADISDTNKFPNMRIEHGFLMSGNTGSSIDPIPVAGSTNGTMAVGVLTIVNAHEKNIWQDMGSRQQTTHLIETSTGVTTQICIIPDNLIHDADTNGPRRYFYYDLNKGRLVPYSPETQWVQ